MSDRQAPKHADAAAEALRAERTQAEQSGDSTRVSQIDEQLRNLEGNAGK